MADNVLNWENGLDSEDRGMYGGGDDSYIEYFGESNQNFDALIDNAGDTSTVYPDITLSMTDVPAETDPYFNVENGKIQILGLPFSFNKVADPDGRVFRNTIMNDLPLLFVVPGKTVLNNKLITDNGSKIGKGTLLSALEAGANILELGVRGARSGTDMRFLGFKQDYSEFYKYVDTALNVVHSTMGLPGLYQFEDSFKEGGKGLSGVRNHGLVFYMDKSTSISEGNSNDYTQTSVAQRANELSAANREAKLMLGINTGGESKGFVGKALSFVTEAVSTLAEGVTSLTGIISRQGNIFGRVVNGSQLLYPDIWTDSAMDKSYNLSFKFYSPYADKESIFEYVYVPFITWVCMAYPRQDNVMGYGQPFVLRINCPG